MNIGAKMVNNIVVLNLTMCFEELHKFAGQVGV